MLLKLFFISVVLYKTAEAGTIEMGEQKVTFSVEKIWLSYKKNSQMCYDDEKHVQGVQEYYTGCRKVFWQFRGLSYCIGDNVIVSFESFITKVLYFSNSNSTVLAWSASEMFITLSKLNQLKGSSLAIIREFNKVLPQVVKDYNRIVETKLSNYIGDVAGCFNDAVADLGEELSNFMTKFLQCSGVECKGKLDQKPVFKKLQKLLNTVALIAETMIYYCDTPIRKHYEAVTILSLIFGHFSLAVQGINSCVQDHLYGANHHLSKDIEFLSKSLDFVVVDANNAIFEINYPFNKKTKKSLLTYVKVTLTFNRAIKDILGVFEGVAITRGKIVKNLSKCCTDLDDSVLKDRTNIVKGITHENF